MRNTRMTEETKLGDMLKSISLLAEERVRRAGMFKCNAHRLAGNFKRLMSLSDEENRMNINNQSNEPVQIYLPIVARAIEERKLPGSLSLAEFLKAMDYDLGPGLTATLYENIDWDCGRMGGFRGTMENMLIKGDISQELAEDVSQVYSMMGGSCKCYPAEFFWEMLEDSPRKVEDYFMYIEGLSKKQSPDVLKRSAEIPRFSFPEWGIFKGQIENLDEHYRDRNILIAGYLNDKSLSETVPKK